MTAAFAALPGGRVLQYHNVTPAHYFAGYDRRCSGWRRSDGKSSARWSPRGSGARRFGLQPAGARGDRVRPHRRLPIAVDTERVSRPVHLPALESILDDGW